MIPILLSAESFVFRPDPECIFKKVSALIGCPGSQSHGPIQEKIQKIIQQAFSQIRVAFAYKEAPLIHWSETYIAADDVRIDSPRWSELVRLMESPRRVCAFVITLGAGFDQWVEKIQSGSILEGFIADAFGAAYVEAAAGALFLELERCYAEINLACTRRLSPGYCDWDLEKGQKALFEFLHPETIGVVCRASGLMMPLKTISAVFFAGEKVLHKTPCMFCPHDSCAHRRQARQPTAQA